MTEHIDLNAAVERLKTDHLGLDMQSGGDLRTVLDALAEAQRERDEALAVIEEQRKPSEDEREVLLMTILEASATPPRVDKWETMGGNIVNAVLAAGFRRPPRRSCGKYARKEQS